MGLSTAEATLWWAQAAFSALPWLTARSSIAVRRLSHRTTRWWLPPDVLLVVAFVVAWTLALVAMWVWGRTSDGRGGDLFDVVNWLYFADVVLQCAWVCAINERGREYGLGAVVAMMAALVSLVMMALMMRAGALDGGAAWTAAALWTVVALWQVCVAVYSLGFFCGRVHHVDEDDRSGTPAAAAAGRAAVVVDAPTATAQRRTGR